MTDLNEIGAAYVVLVSREGVIRFVGQCEGGPTPDQLLGHRVVDRVPSEARQALAEGLERVFQTGKIEFIHMPAPAHCEHPGRIEIKVVPLAGSGKPPQTVAVAFRRVVSKGSGANRLVDPRESFSPLTSEELPCERSLKDRERIMNRLRQTEERARQIAEVSLHGIVIAQHGRLVYANPAAGEVLECPAEELVGRSVEDLARRFVGEDSLDLVPRILNDTIEGMTRETAHEIIIRTSSGRSRWIQVAALPVTHEGDQAIQAALIDITSQKEAEKALRESEDKYRTLVENARNAIFSMEYDGTIRFMNCVAASMLGGEVRGYVGRNVMELFPPDKAARHLAAVQRVIDSGKAQTVENLTELQGQPRWHITSIHPLKGEPGKTGSAFLISTDITEHKLDAQQLARERDFTRMILETANSLIFCLDGDARVLLFNQECERVTGYRSEEVVGKRWPDIFVPDRFRHDGLDDFASWVKEHPADRREEPILTKAGEERVILWSNSSFTHPDTGEITAIAIGHDVTEAKRAEQQLKETESRFRSLIEGIPALTYTAALDENSTTIYISPQIESLLGFTPEDYVSDPDLWTEQLHPDDRDRVLAEVRRCHDTGENFLCEYRMIHRNGRVVWFRDHAVILRDESGRPLCLQGIQYDITESKAAEEKLRESESRFQELADLLPQPVFECDTTGRFTFVNKSGLELFGRSKQDLGRGAHVLDALHPCDRQRAWRNLLKLSNGSSSTGNEYTAIRSDGSQFPVLAYSTQICRNGEVVGYRGILLDMTRHKEAERALRESQGRFERVAQQSREMVWEVNADGLFTYVSQASDEILGYRPDEMIGKMHFYDLQSAEEREEFRRASLRQIAMREPFHNQVNKALTKTGQFVWFLTSGSPVVDEFGNLKVYVGADLDITERVEMERNLTIKDRAIASSINALGLASLDGRITYVNDAFVRMWGYPSSELMGVPIIELAFPSGDVAEVMSAIKTQGRYFGESVARRKDGSPFDIQVSASLVTDAPGQPLALLATFIDITERKRHEAAVKMSEERFRALYKGNPLPTYTWQWNGSEFVLIDCNYAASTATEGRIRSYLGLSADKIYQDQPQYIQDLHTCYENRATINREMRYFTRLSTERMLELAVRYNFVPPDFVLVVTEDITQRKHDEEALRMSEERFRGMYDGSPLPMVLFQWKDGDLQLVKCNKATSVASRGALPNLVGSPAKHIFAKEPEFLQTLYDCFHNQGSVNVDYSHQMWDTNGQVYVTVFASFIPPDLLLIQAQDISERKQMEEALRSTNELLAQERQALFKKNIALQEVLGQAQDEANQVRQNVQSNINKLILPIVSKLREKAREGDRIDLDLLESMISDVASPFLRDLETRYRQLTPRETEICNMIRNGLQSKEIGPALDISVRTVEKFRQKIRKKLGVYGRDTNLTTFLRSIDGQ